jgi:hypothetical protein
MTQVGRKVMILFGAMAALVVVTGCSGSTPPPGGTNPITNYDKFNRDLAKRISEVLGSGAAPEFQVVVTAVNDPIGTLYLKGRSVAVDDTSCRPAINPDARSMPSAFPSYTLDNKAAGELGIDSGVLQGVASAGANLSDAASFAFAVASPHLQALTDKALTDLVDTGACNTALLKNKDMVLIRGYVIGQRSFSTTTKVAAGANVGVTKVGSLNISVASNGAVNITDDAPQAFLQVITEVAPRLSVNAPAQFSVPKQVSGVGHIYVQQDRADDPRKGSSFVKLLQVAGFGDVATQVERTNSARTPNTAQVRYFNEADKARALEVLNKLKVEYPDAKLVPIKLPAPPGQLEVWFPRAR